MEWSLEPGRKRHPSDDLSEEQPLSKRLSLLNLNPSCEDDAYIFYSQTNGQLLTST